MGSAHERASTGSSTTEARGTHQHEHARRRFVGRRRVRAASPRKAPAEDYAESRAASQGASAVVDVDPRKVCAFLCTDVRRTAELGEQLLEALGQQWQGTHGSGEPGELKAQPRLRSLSLAPQRAAIGVRQRGPLGTITNEAMRVLRPVTKCPTV
jgi:hypothetical protein